MSEAMMRIQANALEQGRIQDQIAKMLYENGEMLAQTEGGSMPSWEQITEECKRIGADSEDEMHAACWQWHFDHLHRADLILGLDGSSCLALAKILIDRAVKQHADMEHQLWGKVERAAGFERGSLTGKPGVKQRVYL